MPEADPPRLPTTSVSLTDDELALLDGRCRPDVQAKVDAALNRIAAARTLPHLPPHLSGLVADILAEARSNGIVVMRDTRVTYCRLCGTHAGHATYKSGPNRGLPNLKRPLTLPGYEFASRNVTMKGHVTLGGCRNCVDPILDAIRDALAGVHAEISPRLRVEGQPVYRRHGNRLCTKCGWEGHDGQMKRRPTVLGDGTYPAECPACGATNTMFNVEVKPADGHTVVRDDG